MLFNAIEFAARAHRGQWRKTTRVPYVVHCANVGRILARYRFPEYLVAAGFLHDVLEDTSTSFAELCDAFGLRVATLVQAVSNTDRTQGWDVRKYHAIQRLTTAPIDVVILKAADQLDNLQSLRNEQDMFGPAVWQLLGTPKAAEQWYFRELDVIFADRLLTDPERLLRLEFHQEAVRTFADAR
jgi:(p)ppGpp synthase/HD superfamily hydrolase